MGVKKLISSLFGKLLPAKEAAIAAPPIQIKPEIKPIEKVTEPSGHVYSTNPEARSPDKDQKLELLCAQLFKNKELITSGKLQLLGLAQIKQRIGKRWEGLSKIVYETVETVIKENVSKGDVFIRFKDDTYVLIFAQASCGEGQRRAAIIAEEIQRRLFSRDEEELKTIDVQQAIASLKTSLLIEAGFPAFMDKIAAVQPEKKIAPPKPLVVEAIIPPITVTEVSAKTITPATTTTDPIEEIASNIPFSYIPIWDTDKKALMTYLCLAGTPPKNVNPFVAYKTIIQRRTKEDRVSLDLIVLKRVLSDINTMVKEGRKFLIACPVQYETLFQFNNYSVYRELLQKIPQDHKQFLVFLVMPPEKDMPQKDPLWFIAGLKGFSRYVFLEINLSRGMPLRMLRDAGVTSVGITLDENKPEKETIEKLNLFCSSALTYKFAHIFVLGVSSLSLTTSAVCAGCNYLAGPAIHDIVPNPDKVYRYRHEDIVSALIEK